MKTSQHLNFLLTSVNGAIQQKRRRSILSLFFSKNVTEISGINLIHFFIGSFFWFLLCFTVVRCQSLQASHKGHVSPNSCKVSPEYGTTCYFSCTKGYRLHGDPVTSCLSDGRWSKDTNVSCKGQLKFLLVFFNNFREPDFDFKSLWMLIMSHISGSNYGYLDYLWHCFSSRFAFKLKRKSEVHSLWRFNCNCCPSCRIGNCTWLRFQFHCIISYENGYFPQTFKALRSVWLALATLNDSQTEERTLQQWPGQQSSPLTTLALSQPLLRVVWRAYFTEGDILSRTTPLMRQEIIKPAGFSSLSRVRPKNWCPCSLRFVFIFDSLV